MSGIKILTMKWLTTSLLNDSKVGEFLKIK